MPGQLDPPLSEDDHVEDPRDAPLELVMYGDEASEAAAAQGAFWPMHEHLYAARSRLSDGDLVQHSRDLGLDAERVARELSEHVHAERVAADHASGERSGVLGTPDFIVNGTLHAGSFDAGSLIEALEGAPR